MLCKLRYTAGAKETLVYRREQGKVAQGFGHSNVFLNLGPRSSGFVSLVFGVSIVWRWLWQHRVVGNMQVLRVQSFTFHFFAGPRWLLQFQWELSVLGLQGFWFSDLGLPAISSPE